MENKTFIMTSRGWATTRDYSTDFEKAAYVPQPVRDAFRKGDGRLLVIHWDGEHATPLDTNGRFAQLAEEALNQGVDLRVTTKPSSDFVHKDDATAWVILGVLGGFIVGCYIGAASASEVHVHENAA